MKTTCFCWFQSVQFIRWDLQDVLALGVDVLALGVALWSTNAS